MEDQTKNLQGGVPDPDRTIVDPEKTLVAPRFDARESLTAQPVVPLAEVPAARRERRQGTLPLVLILISALVGGLVSVFAYRLYQQRAQVSAGAQQQPTVGESPAPQQQQPEPTPELAAEATVATPEVIEEFAPPGDEEIAEVREKEEAAPEATPARGESKEDKAEREPEAARERAGREERPAARSAPEAERARQPGARRVEEITAPTRDMRVRRERSAGREASEYEVPARPRANRRVVSRARPQRNIDRVRAIFEGSPPAP